MKTPQEVECLRQENFARISIGNKDLNGNDIYGVYAKGDEFAIYSTDPKGSIRGVRVRIDTKDPDDDTPIANFQAVKGEFDKLKFVSDRCSDPSFAARAAHALSVAIYGNPNEAKTILDEIYKNIESEYKEKVIGKLVYVSGTFFVSSMICFAGLCLYFFRPGFVFNDHYSFYEIVLSTSMATLGGIISVSKNLHFVNVDKGLGKLPYFFYGIERSVFSIIGGIFVYFLVKSNLLFGFLNELDDSLYAILIFCFLAGFSETFIPNALNSIESRAQNE